MLLVRSVLTTPRSSSSARSNLFLLRTFVARSVPLQKEATPLGTPYSKLTIGIPKETFPLERRVAATPESIARLLKKEFGAVHVEKGAGALSYYTDASYQSVGAEIVDDAWKEADIVLKVSGAPYVVLGYTKTTLSNLTFPSLFPPPSIIIPVHIIAPTTHTGGSHKTR